MYLISSLWMKVAIVGELPQTNAEQGLRGNNIDDSRCDLMPNISTVNIFLEQSHNDTTPPFTQPLEMVANPLDAQGEP
ncbi:MAG: hypothetical protein MPJ24_09725 [Pirellulaceae bacterium]|nr:hypothetical protein [Pirellulaceae bacterium]